MSGRPPWKARAALVLQLCVSAGLLAWIFREPEFRADVAGLIRTASPAWLIAAFGVAGVGAILGFVRWGIFVRVVGIPLPAWDIFRMGAVGLLFNSFLPGAVGGDGVKVGWLVARKFPPRAAFLSVVMDRLSGLGAMVICSAVFIGFRYEWLMRSATVAAMIHAVILYLVGVVVLVSISFFLASRGAVSRLPKRFPARAAAVEFAETYSLFLGAWRATGIAASISLFTLLAYFFTFFCAAEAVGVHVPMVDFLAIMPVVDVAAALPISAGGFGVREAAFSTLLGQLAGVPSAEAVSISFAGALATMLWGGLGLFALPARRREAR
jgi:glycosyltransferase 2 family protein